MHSVTTRTTSPFRDLGDLTQVVPVRRTRGNELDLSQLVGTSAEWKVKVIPPRDANKTLPKVDSDNIYGFARNVKAA